jgi:hypothetical protein
MQDLSSFISPTENAFVEHSPREDYHNLIYASPAIFSCKKGKNVKSLNLKTAHCDLT